MNIIPYKHAKRLKNSDFMVFWRQFQGNDVHGLPAYDNSQAIMWQPEEGEGSGLHGFLGTIPRKH